MSIDRPRPYYRVAVVAGDYSWIIERDPDDPPPTPDYGLADPLRVKVGLPTTDLLYATPAPCEGSFSLILDSMADIAGLSVGDGVNVRVWLFPVGTIDPSTGDPYPDWPEVNMRGRVANIDAQPHPLGMFVSVRFVDYSVDLAELSTGRSDWPAETVEVRLDRIGTELGVSNLGSELIQFGNVAARLAAPTDARSLLTSFLDGLAYTRPESVGTVMAGDGYKLIVGSVYDNVDAETPSADRWWTLGVSNRLDFAAGELPAVLGEVTPGVYGVVVDDTPDEKLARILSADHVSFAARYGLAKSDRVNSWRVTLPDGTSELVTEGGPARVESAIQTSATDHRDARSVGRFNLNGSDSDGWKADRFTWYADMDPHRLRYPHLLFWDDVTFLRWFQFDPIVVDGIPAYQNPTGETWYAGQLAAAEFVLADGHYSVDMETRRNLPLPQPDEPYVPVDTALAEYLADSPSFLYKMNSYSSGFADLSGNGRNLDTLSGVAPSAAATGPDGNPAARWTASAGFLRTSYLGTSPAIGTFEFFIKFAANPAADLILFTFGPNSGSAGSPNYVDLTPAGKIQFGTTLGTTGSVVLSTSALALNTWHHVACSWGTGGMKMRVNKVDTGVPANLATTANAVASSSFRAHGYWTGSADGLNVGAVDLAWAAFYPTKLSDARTDAHRDAVLAGPPSPPSTAGEYLRPSDLDPALVVADLVPNLSAFDVRLLRSEL